MELWFPPEILVRIVSYLSDINDLLVLHQVNHDWSKAAETELQRWGYLSVDPATMSNFDAKYKKLLLRKRITDVALIIPDRDYWHVRDPNDGSVTTLVPDSFANFERLRETLKKKIPNLPNLARLSFYIRPPREDLAPVSAGPVIEKSRTLSRNLTALSDALKKLSDRRVINRSLKELSLQCLPARIGFPSVVNRSWNDKAAQIEKTIRRLDLQTLKLGIVSPTVWQFGNSQFATDPPGWTLANTYDPPNIWTTGGAFTLKHLSISYWGFYMKYITGSRYVDIFQNLATLELKGCAFTSDKQLNWLLAHKKVRSLTLDDCPIVYKLLLKDRNPKKEDCASVDMVIEKGGAMQEYKLVWSQVFSRLLAWPNLREFKFGSSRVRQPGEEGPVFQSECTIGPPLGQKPAKFLFGLFPDRYLHLANGTDSCEWILRPSTAQMKRPDWVVNAQDSDRAALLNLLSGIGQEAVENDKSEHAGYVVDLIGKVKKKRRSQ